MARYAIIEGGKVRNVILAEPGNEPAGAVACDRPVGPGWSYDGQTFTAPPAPGPQRTGLTRGQFRLLFTFNERAAEQAYGFAAKAAAEAGTATSEQLAYLAMQADFKAAASINLNDPAVSAALDFYQAWSILTAERKAQVLAGEAPA